MLIGYGYIGVKEILSKKVIITSVVEVCWKGKWFLEDIALKEEKRKWWGWENRIEFMCCYLFFSYLIFLLDWMFVVFFNMW